MYTSNIILALTSTLTLVSAHGKVAVVTGNKGGNGTAFGIKGGIVPGPGPNYLTEVDTTIFWSKDIRTDQDIGFTEDSDGNNQLTDLSTTMAMSGDTLPQISSGGSVNGTYHIVVTDGAGPLQVLMDETATATWSNAKELTVTTQVPGTDGYIAAPSKRGLMGRAMHKVGMITKRTENVNEDYPFSVAIPAGTACTGTINGISGLCLIKVSNNNENGPFGGVFVVQMSNSTTA